MVSSSDSIENRRRAILSPLSLASLSQSRPCVFYSETRPPPIRIRNSNTKTDSPLTHPRPVRSAGSSEYVPLLRFEASKDVRTVLSCRDDHLHIRTR